MKKEVGMIKSTDVEFDASRYVGFPKRPLLTKWGLEALSHGVSESEVRKTISRMSRKSSPEIAKWMKEEYLRWQSDSVVNMADLIESVGNAVNALEDLKLHLATGSEVNRHDRSLISAAKQFVKSFREISEEVVEELIHG